jgi:hypothetical protein
MMADTRWKNRNINGQRKGRTQQFKTMTHLNNKPSLAKHPDEKPNDIANTYKAKKIQTCNPHN